MAHRHVTAHRSTLPVLVQQSKCSLEWHTGKCGLTETRPCADPTEQKLIGMALREHASGESLQKPLPVLVQEEEEEEEDYKLWPTKHMLFDKGTRRRRRNLQVSASQHSRSLVPIMAIMFKSS